MDMELGRVLGSTLDQLNLTSTTVDNKPLHEVLQKGRLSRAGGGDSDDSADSDDEGVEPLSLLKGQKQFSASSLDLDSLKKDEAQPYTTGQHTVACNDIICEMKRMKHDMKLMSKAIVLLTELNKVCVCYSVIVCFLSRFSHI